MHPTSQTRGFLDKPHWETLSNVSRSFKTTDDLRFVAAMYFARFLGLFPLLQPSRLLAVKAQPPKPGLS